MFCVWDGGRKRVLVCSLCLCRPHTAAPARVCYGRSSTASTADLSLAEEVKDVTAAVHLSRHIIVHVGVLMQANFIAGNYLN